MAAPKNKRTKSVTRKSQALKKNEHTEEEKALIADYSKRSERKSLKLKIVKDCSGLQKMEIQATDELLAHTRLMETLGTTDNELQTFLIDQVIRTFQGCVSSEGFDNDRLAEFGNNALAILQGIAPKDEIEGMLAVQIIGVHNLAMAAMSGAIITGQTFEGRQASINQATKMLRTFTAQMEALKRYRTGGQQKMVIEHIYVNEGGQAIVGTVNQGGGGNKDEKRG